MNELSSRVILAMSGAAIVILLTFGVAVAQTESSAPANPAPANAAAATKDSSVYDELRKAPNKAVARRNPLEGDPDAVAAGGKLFELHCAGCHGAMADGGKKGPSLRAEEVQQATPGALFWVLTNGVVRRGMPVWSKLPEPQRWQLVRYIKSLTSAPRPNPDGDKTPLQDNASSHPPGDRPEP